MNVKTLIKSSGFEYEIFEHEPVYTSEEAAKVRNVPLRLGVKALVFETENEFILALVPANKKVDTKKLGYKKIKLAHPNKVFEITGCKIGAVPPFGHKTELKTFVDPEILKNEWVYFNIGEHTQSAKMHGNDIIKLIKHPIAMNITK